ncbi:M28 family peptidase [Halorubrum ezzemoulense]|uniref:M28 family metallopeptidase n=1 Tax=Halorubrum ezzemoulense TaxID=337243 RepID=UPI00232B87B8|nr:M28 family peptidase [Halorubrum ezzemoulense]MDB2282710.1 M28 family peptidase [Halorubrum ezzemoulense]
MDGRLYEGGKPSLSGVDAAIVDDVSADEPWSLVERFAELERVSGTEGERSAAAYVTDRLDGFSIDHELFEPSLYLSTPHGASIETDDRWTAASAKTVSFSANGTVGGDLVYVENDDEMESIESMLSVSLDGLPSDLSGTVVLSESIIPISAIGELSDRGAEAFIGIHPHEREPHEGIVTPVWGGAPPYEDRERVPDLLVANVSASDGRKLRERAANGAEVTVSAETTTEWKAAPLVVAKILGAAAPAVDEFVLAHGHIDSWHEGVTDNATGDAALLELARVLHDHREKLRRDVWVAWWPGHSTGRYAGSTWFTDEFAAALAERCVAHVNVDSPGVADATAYDERVKWMAAVHDVAVGAIEDVSGKATAEFRPARAGDYSFNNLGVPGMSLQSSIPEPVREERGYHPVGGSGGHADAWHLTTDTIEKFDPDVLKRDTEVYTLATARLSRAERPADPVRAIDRLASVAAEYDAASGFDLGPVIDELDELRGATMSFLDDADGYPDAADRLVKRVTRLQFVTEGEFKQDPAESRPPFPRLAPVERLADLDGDEERFLELQLQRARNDILAELRRLRRSL